MRKPVTILLTLLLSALILGLAAAVPHGALQEETIAAHKRAYQPAEFDFLNSFGEDSGEDDPGLDFGADEADFGFDFGDEEEEDYGFDFGDE